MSDERSATSIDIKIGQRVRRRRLEIGMSQERLAELIGVTFQQVQKYEKGVNRIAVSRLLDIAESLEVPASFLIDRLQKSERKAPQSAADGLSLQALQVAQAWESIADRAVRRNLHDLIVNTAGAK